MSETIESLRARVEELQAELAAIKQQEPVAWVMQSSNDASIGMQIAPVGWSTFSNLRDKLLQHAWIKAGAAKLIPLYLGPALIPEGWQLVPKEPDEKMTKAGEEMFEATLHSSAGFAHHAVRVFMAMLSAAPKPGDKP